MPAVRVTPSAVARVRAAVLVLIGALWLTTASALTSAARASIPPARTTSAPAARTTSAPARTTSAPAARTTSAPTAATRTVTFDAATVTVPRAWPVIYLGRDAHACVRFDRHALYLGTPGRFPACAQRGVGRSEAILIEPVTRRPGLLPVSRPGADAPRGTALSLIRGHARIIATWNHDPGLIERALRAPSLTPLADASRTRPAAVTLARPARAARAAAGSPPASGPSTPGEVYTGEGFDACSTPSTSTMSAWSSSPYRAVGVYIGGANMACSQPNLTSTWVGQESAAGWHLVPIYVGLQAPTNACGCAAISPSSAAAEGSAAADDAVTQAQAVGLGTGNPLYFDMEGYNRNATNTKAVLTFLQAWTQALHAAGYLSGVYSSDDSGIVDLVSRYGTGYTEPDELWFANWNNQATTTDTNVPSADWASHQRLHQYQGGHNETYGGARINIDSDYLDASTAAGGTGTASSAPAPPAASKPPTLAGAAIVGQTLTEIHGGWSGDPSSYSLQWLDCDASGANCASIPGATNPTYTVTSTDVGHRIRVLEAAAGPGGTGQPSSSQPTAATLSRPVSGYWLLSSFGNVFNSPGASFLGSPVRRGLTDISGIAPTRSGRGYWIATRDGRVFAFGNASRTPPPPPGPRVPVIGIAGDPAARGYWLVTSAGDVIAVRSPFLGSPAAAHRHPGPIAGLAVAAGGHGYWVAAASGHVFAFGAAGHFPAPVRPHRVRGIVAEPGSRGYWLFTAQGDVYDVASRFYGSPAAAHLPVSNVVGMASTPDGDGYWLVTSSGRTFAYGDAASFSLPRMPHPTIAIAGS